MLHFFREFPRKRLGGFIASPHPHQDWSQTNRGVCVSVRGRPILQPGTKIFAMGSCFAREIRSALRTRGYDVYPKYFDVDFDPDRQKVGKLPDKDNQNHYTTFSIRQEIERVIDRRSWTDDDLLRRRSHKLISKHGWSQVFQDPYRYDVYGSDIDAALDVSGKIGTAIRVGLERADVIILTLGLTECWRNRANGMYVCRGPESENDELFSQLEFRRSGFVENYENVAATIDRILTLGTTKAIVLTVSPVPLQLTWTGQDIVVANMASKSILRAVADAVCRDRPQVLYWPSFEYASRRDVFCADGRHVREDAVADIVDAFTSAHSAMESAVAA
jgi:hypothetical protein